MDAELICRYLHGLRAVAGAPYSALWRCSSPASATAGSPAARSDMLQAGRVHSGVTQEPPDELERLFAAHWGAG